MLTSMPFVHTISVVKVSGKIFLDALEWSVSRYDFQGKAGRGEFLQLSGVKVKYDLSKRSGSRVVSVKVRCASCNIPAYHDLNLEEDYNLIMPTFLYFGGDNFKMFEKNGTEIFRFGKLDRKALDSKDPCTNFLTLIPICLSKNYN